MVLRSRYGKETIRRIQGNLYKEDSSYYSLTEADEHYSFEFPPGTTEVKINEVSSSLNIFIPDDYKELEVREGLCYFQIWKKRMVK